MPGTEEASFVAELHAFCDYEFALHLLLFCLRKDFSHSQLDSVLYIGFLFYFCVRFFLKKQQNKTQLFHLGICYSCG